MADRNGAWVRYDAGWGWAHRPWWKVAINTVLRLVQPGVRRKWVIFTRCEAGRELDHAPVPPRVLGYGFGQITHRTAGELIERMTLPEPAAPPRLEVPRG